MRAKRFQSVWDAIEASPAQAESMKLRSSLMLALTDHIEREQLGKAAAATMLGVTELRIADLIQGKIDQFDVDRLIEMLFAAGLRITVHVDKAA